MAADAICAASCALLNTRGEGARIVEIPFNPVPDIASGAINPVPSTGEVHVSL